MKLRMNENTSNGHLQATVKAPTLTRKNGVKLPKIKLKPNFNLFFKSNCRDGTVCTIGSAFLQLKYSRFPVLKHKIRHMNFVNKKKLWLFIIKYHFYNFKCSLELFKSSNLNFRIEIIKKKIPSKILQKEIHILAHWKKVKSLFLVD